jgi:hypothetical protein
MKATEIIDILNVNEIKVTTKEKSYNGSYYIEKYSIVDSDIVSSKTYDYLPTEVRSQGFITKKGVLQNFFYHNGEGFVTTSDINVFLKVVKKGYVVE